jgi:hypothetical protein
MSAQHDLAYFSEATSAETVNARIVPDKADPRVAEVVAALTRHLHAFVKEVEPTHEEWLAGIQFLTKTGHMCTDWRQEFILLSDVLGVSMLVDAINARRPSGATENTILGPFYVQNRPMLPDGANICQDGKGEPCLVSGVVRDTDGRPIAGAVVDVWQTSRACSRKATCAGLSRPTLRGDTPSARCARASIRSRMTGPSASCWPSSAATRTARRISTRSSRRTGLTR